MYFSSYVQWFERSLLHPSSKAACSSKMLFIYQTTWYHIPEDHNINPLKCNTFIRVTLWIAVVVVGKLFLFTFFNLFVSFSLSTFQNSSQCKMECNILAHFSSAVVFWKLQNSPDEQIRNCIYNFPHVPEECVCE
jgi:hypothetical protein